MISRTLVVVAIGVATGACRGQGSVAHPGDPCVDPMASFEPWDRHSPVASRPPTPAVGLLDGLVAWYQHALRRPELPGSGCPYAPSCSVFARGALARFGPVGLLAVVDRLIVREHALAGDNHRTVCVDGYLRWHDPVP